MRARAVSLAIVLFMLVVLVPLAWSSNSTPEAEAAAPLVNCSQVRISLSQVRINCTAAGIVVLNTVVNLPQAPPITLPPIVGPTIRVPGPTVRVPGPTQTVTVNVPQATQTVKVPGPTVTKTAQPTVGPTVSATETITVSPSGQGPSEDDTLGPRDPVVRLPDIRTVPQAIGLGLLAILVFIALGTLLLMGGYTLGFKDKERKEKAFLGALLDQTTGRRR